MVRGTRKNYIFFALAALCCALVFVCAGCSKTEVAVETTTEEETTENKNSVYSYIDYNGKVYTYNSSLTNILFLGIDKSDVINTEYSVGDAGQSDCIILLSLNDETQEVTILQINRNTMTDIDIYDTYGNYSRTIEGQICLQYAYNTGGSRSARSAETTVSELLYGLTIDGYFALDISGVPEINDSLGGVDVTCSYDYTYIDESYTEGAVVHLEGEAAQTFVQYRDIEEFNSVEGRMYRQVDYVTALIAAMNESSGTDLYELLSPYMDTYVITDLDSDELNSMRKYTYLTDEVLYLPGETVMGEKYEEFYVDEAELQDLIMETFYVEVEE